MRSHGDIEIQRCGFLMSIGLPGAVSCRLRRAARGHSGASADWLVGSRSGSLGWAIKPRSWPSFPVGCGASKSWRSWQAKPKRTCASSAALMSPSASETGRVAGASTRLTIEPSNQTQRTDRSAAGSGRGAMAHGGRQRGGWADQCSETDPGAVQPTRDGRVRHSYPYRSAPQARSLAAPNDPTASP